MNRIGNDDAGFTVDFDVATSTVHVRAWGFWNSTVAGAFCGAVRDECRNAAGAATVTLDMTLLKPMRDEGQQSVGALLRLLPALGVGKVTIVIGSQLTKLQLLRLASESGAKRYLEFVDAA